MDAYYGLGLTYFSQLFDYKKSIGAFDTLIKQYPTTTYKAQSYYGLYLDYTKIGDTAQATKYKKLLNKEFGESLFSQIANNPEYLNEIKNKEKYILHHYDSTYTLYKDTKYREALSQVEFAKTTYKNHPLLPKYLLVEAICYAGLKNFVKSKEILTNIIANYANTPEQFRSTAILNYLLAHNTDSITAKIDSNTIQKSIITNPGNTKSEDSIEASVSFTDLRKSEGSGHFEYEPNSSHFVLVFIKNVDGRTMALKSALSDYNLMKHGVEEYSTGLNLFTAQQAVVTVREFSNQVFAKQYMNEMKGEKNIFTQFQKNEYEICIISKANQEELLKTRDILGYLKFYKQKYK
jgi:transcription antitermination factor NusG